MKNISVLLNENGNIKAVSEGARFKDGKDMEIPDDYDIENMTGLMIEEINNVPDA